MQTYETRPANKPFEQHTLTGLKLIPKISKAQELRAQLLNIKASDPGTTQIAAHNKTRLNNELEHGLQSQILRQLLLI